MKNKGVKKGFSLIELLLSISIILIVCTVTIKAYSDYVDIRIKENVCTRNKDVFCIIYEDIAQNESISNIDINEDVYINIQKDTISRVREFPIKNLVSTNHNEKSYIMLRKEEDLYFYTIKMILYCDNNICAIKNIRRSKIVI